MSLTHPKKSYWDSSEDAPVGTGVKPAGIFRSFFRMDTSKVIGKHILRAIFSAYQNSGPCEPNVELWVTEEITPKTTWLKQPKWLKRLDAGTASDPYGGCFFGWTVTDLVTEAAARGDRYITFGLRSAHETGPRELHVFESDVASDPYFGKLPSPWLHIDYNTAPHVPSELRAWSDTFGVGCSSSGVPTGDGGYVRTTTPALSAKFTDEDETWQQIRGRFQWAVPGGDTLGEFVTEFTYVGSTQRICVPSGALADGGTYVWRVRAEDQYQPAGSIEFGSEVGEWSPWQAFTVDVTPPGQPVVSSTAYPEKVVGARVGTPGEFLFAPNGASDVVSYQYSITPAGPAGTVAAGSDGTAIVTFTPTRDLPMKLTVSSTDRAGNRSPTKVYEFRAVRNPAPTVSSTVYPQNQYGGGVGIPGEFTFALNGAQDVVRYSYRLNGSLVEVPVGEDGTAKVTVTPDTADENVLSVSTVDKFGYSSLSRTYIFFVNTPPPTSSPVPQP
ncbi:hypothetical protein AB0B89_27935 [Sphaerisporangium sp. NPDC049002]|uniref:hypothetical protein n=1 Tax=Sphaerisporangium sp. NPDC049002 TaxID=3155392 RepID=UPI003400C880